MNEKLNNDIALDLLQKVQTTFDEGMSKSEVINSLDEVIQANKATYKEANEYSIEVGQILADSFKKHLTHDNLPDGRLYKEMARIIVEPALKNNHKVISKVTLLIQQELNRQAGIGIKAVKANVNKSAITRIIDRVSDEEKKLEDAIRVLGEPVINFSQNVINDILAANFFFQGKAGLKPRIVRTLVGGACDWCVALAGTYTYPNTPKDVFRRHERCRCTCEYQPEGLKSRSQDVWSKKWK